MRVLERKTNERGRKMRTRQPALNSATVTGLLHTGGKS